MEYIGNKLRRYTTFSKRKTGIMKKVDSGDGIGDRVHVRRDQSVVAHPPDQTI